MNYLRHHSSVAQNRNPPIITSQRPQRRVSPLLTVCRAKATTHYDALGVPTSATAADIKSAFRKLALQLHPDINKEPNAVQRFVACKEAYETLADDERRQEYDFMLHQGTRSVGTSRTYQSANSGSVTFTNGYTTTTWEFVGFGDDDVEDVFAADSDDEDDDDEDAYAFRQWVSKVGNLRSSYQSSEKANRKKNRAKTAAATAAAARRGGAPGTRRKDHSVEVDLASLLASFDPTTRRALQATFGTNLEGMDSLEDLQDVLQLIQLLGDDDDDDDGPSSRRVPGPRASNWTGPGDWETFIQSPGPVPGRRNNRGGRGPSGGSKASVHTPGASAAGRRATAPNGRTAAGGAARNRDRSGHVQLDDDDDDDDDMDMEDFLVDLSELGFAGWDSQVRGFVVEDDGGRGRRSSRASPGGGKAGGRGSSTRRR